jgi:PAS domain S-box-containing protein
MSPIMLAAKETQNEVLLSYMDIATCIFLVIKADHTIELINKKGCEILGLHREEIIGKNWFKIFIPKTDRIDLSKMFDQVLAGEVQSPKTFENWVLTGINKQKLIRWQSTVLTNESGKGVSIISSGTDITEQLEVESSLRASENKNKAILEAIPDLIMVQDYTGKILEVKSSNPSTIFESFEHINGKGITDVFSKVDADNLKEAIQKTHKTQKSQHLELLVEENNQHYDLEMRLVPFQKNKILSVTRNITSKKALLETLSIRNMALEVAGNGIIIVDGKSPDLPIIYSNAAFTEITGYPKNDVFGKNCRFLQNDDRDQEAIEILGTAIANQSSSKVVLRNYKKDGTLFWNELTITPLFDNDHNLTHFIGVQNDITEMIEARKRIEEYAGTLEQKVEEHTKELKETIKKLVAANNSLQGQILSRKKAEIKAQTSQAMFVAIAKNFPKGVIMVFNHHYELVYIDGKELERIDIQKANYEGKRITELPLFNEIQKNKLQKDVKRTLEGENVSSEIEFQGQIYTVNSTPLYSDFNDIVWGLFVYNNVTGQKQVQIQLENSLKSEQELNELKSRFISMASHEFRTPLSAILSSAILIGKQNEAGKEDKRLKHVSRIRTNVKNLVVILNDFLSLSKLEEGRVKANPQHFELVQFIDLLIEEMKPAKKVGQSIIYKIHKKNITVYLDPKLLSHILINLLSNAIKYSNEGQEIKLEVSQHKNDLQITVTDYGIGIPEDEQKHLFERFFRAKNASNIQGTGLGLHIVRQYAELMSGTVDFTSKKGKQTTFKLRLPIKMC